jgi:hypothetical protein
MAVKTQLIRRHICEGLWFLEDLAPLLETVETPGGVQDRCTGRTVHDGLLWTSWAPHPQCRAPSPPSVRDGNTNVCIWDDLKDRGCFAGHELNLELWGTPGNRTPSGYDPAFEDVRCVATAV